MLETYLIADVVTDDIAEKTQQWECPHFTLSSGTNPKAAATLHLQSTDLLPNIVMFRTGNFFPHYLIVC